MPSKHLNIHWTEITKGTGQAASRHWDLGLRVSGLYRHWPDDEIIGWTTKTSGHWAFVACVGNPHAVQDDSVLASESDSLSHPIPFALSNISILSHSN